MNRSKVIWKSHVKQKNYEKGNLFYLRQAHKRVRQERWLEGSLELRTPQHTTQRSQKVLPIVFGRVIKDKQLILEVTNSNWRFWAYKNRHWAKACCHFDARRPSEARANKISVLPVKNNFSTSFHHTGKGQHVTRSLSALRLPGKSFTTSLLLFSIPSFLPSVGLSA